MRRRRGGAGRALVVGAVVVLAGGAAGLIGWQRRVAHRRQAEREAQAWVDPMARVEGCLFGTETSPAGLRELPRHLRRVALGPDALRAWPSRCVDPLAAARLTSPLVEPLRAALRADDAIVTTLRREGTGADLGGWRPAWEALRLDVADRLATSGVSLREPSLADAPRPRAVEVGEELPVSLTESATLAGVSYGDGVLSVMWVDRSRERVFCRSRDGGGTIRCRRFPAPAPSGGVLALLPSDRAEALVLIDQGAGSYGVASADDPWSPLFGLRGIPLASLPLRVRRDVVFAITQRGGHAQFEQVARGAPGAVAPLGPEVALDRESALVAVGDPSTVWWATSTATPGGLALDFRGLGTPIAWRSPASLQSPTALFTACHAGALSYVAIADGAATRVLAIDAQGPRELGTLGALGRTLRLSCDGAGVTVVGDGSFQSCTLTGLCGAPTSVAGLRALARAGDSLVIARAVGEHDAPRVLRRPLASPGDASHDEVVVLSDDTRHGGLASRAAWMFSSGTKLLLFLVGDATVVRWSDDQGRTWHPSREAEETPARPMRAEELAEELRRAHRENPAPR